MRRTGESHPVNEVQPSDVINHQGSTPVDKPPRLGVINRLSPLQREIVEVLRESGAFHNWADREVSLKRIPSPSYIIDLLGRERTNVNYAAVSRSLARLEKAGVVVSYHGYFATQGRGYRYALKRLPRLHVLADHKGALVAWR